MKTFLMCSPEGVYDCLYNINPWMTGNIHNIDKDRAIHQWETLRGVLSEVAQVETRYLTEKLPVPDIVFTANAGLPFKRGKENAMILSSFAYAERRSEIPLQEKWFRDMKYSVYHLGDFFEGAGDALVDTENRLWVGVGKRSRSEVVSELRELTKGYFKEVLEMRLVDSKFYHLDTCFCPLSKGHILWYPGAFDTSSYWKAASLVGHRSSGVYVHDTAFRPDMLIDVTEEDANNFACNAINVDEVIIANKLSDPLRERLNDLGYITIETDMSEFMKAGGAAKCLVLELLD